jgi:glycosyltransferase involved in cell wall biosynthesis
MMLRWVDLVIAVSEATHRQLVDLEPGVADKTLTLYTGLEVVAVCPQHVESTSEELKVVMVGSLTSEKDPMLALEAAASVPAVRLRFVGSGDLRRELIDRAAALGISDRVDFAGSVEDVMGELMRADALILTSRTEGLPGAILEASAACLAVLAVDVGGVREAVVDGETGVVVDRHVEQLAATLRRWVEDREEVRRLGEAGREYVEAKFFVDDVVDQYQMVLRGLLR